MDAAAFLAKWNNGAGLRARANDLFLDRSEIVSVGSVGVFVADLQQLRPDEQSTITAMLRDSALRDEVEGTIDPALGRFLRDFDRNGNHALELSEVGGNGFQRFRDAALALPAQTRRRIADRISDSVVEKVGASLAEALPESFNPRDFGAARFVSTADRQLGDRARAFVRDTLRIDPSTLTDGLRRAHLGPDVIPATPTEATVRALRAELADGSMSLVELGRFLAARPARGPVTLSVPDLAEGLAREPGRFEGNRFQVTGYAREVSRDEGKYLSYSFLKEKWVRVPYIEAIARLGEGPGATGATVEVFERQDGSKLASGFWISLSNPQTAAHDANRRVSISGVIRKASDGAHRLFVDHYENAQ